MKLIIAGLLTLVFGLLDEAIRDRPVRGPWIGTILFGAAALIASGVFAERRRR